jgi:hypothetical protein
MYDYVTLCESSIVILCVLRILDFFVLSFFIFCKWMPLQPSIIHFDKITKEVSCYFLKVGQP